MAPDDFGFVPLNAKPKKSDDDDFGFIPVEDMRPTKRLPTTEVQSAIEGALQSGSLGFADEIEGALKGVRDVTIGDKAFSLESLLNQYRTNRDAARERARYAEEDNPNAYLAGEIGGGLATSLIPGVGLLGAAKGATLGARAFSAAKGGAALGALQGLGNSKADLTRGEVGDTWEDVKKAAGTGAAVGGLVTPAISGLVGSVKKAISPERLRGIAEDRAIKATTGQNISALRKIAGSTSAGQDIGKTEEALRRSGRNLLDEKVLSAFDKVEDLAPKLAGKRQEIGARIGNVGAKVDELTTGAVSGEKIADEILDYSQSIPKTEAGKSLIKKLEAEAENLRLMGNMSFADAQKLKNQFKFNATNQDALISSQDTINKLRRLITDNMDDAVKNTAKRTDIPDADRALLNEYGLLKDKYRTFKGTAEAASDRALKNLSNRYVSPSDYGVGATGAVLGALGGGPVGAGLAGAAGAAVNKAVRERGNSAAALGLDRAANAIENSPAFLKRLGAGLEEGASRGGLATGLNQELTRQNSESRAQEGASNAVARLNKLYEMQGSQAFKMQVQPILDLAKRGDPAAILTLKLLSKSNPEALADLER